MALACVLSAGGAAAQAPAAKPEVIAAADFAIQPFISNPKLSPDGEWILAKMREEVRLLATPKGTDIVSYRWAGNGRVLISFGKNSELMGEDVFVTRLIAYDLATRQGRFVGKEEEGPEGDDILYVDPQGTWMLLSIQKSIYDYPSVYRVDLETLRMKEVVEQRPDVWEWCRPAT